MFTDPMRERTQEEIQLSGVQAQGLELVLDYIYTSKLSLTLANIQTVLDTATHLQVLQVYILIFFHIILIILNYSSDQGHDHSTAVRTVRPLCGPHTVLNLLISPHNH